MSLPVLEKKGDIILGGLFSLHDMVVEPSLSFTSTPPPAQCTRFNFRTFRWMQTMIFAIEEINRNGKLLPNITLGYKIYDSCSTPHQALKAVMELVGSEKGSGVEETQSKDTCPGSVPAVIGDGGSTQSLVVARFLGAFHLPQVDALVQLVKHFGWTWVGVIAGDDAYGRGGANIFADEVRKLGTCVAFQEVIPRNRAQTTLSSIVSKIRSSGARVILVFAVEQDAAALEGLTEIQWLASEAWSTAAILSTPKRHHQILQGSMGFAIRRAHIPGLKDFLLRLHPSSPNALADPFLIPFWEEVFQCSLCVQAEDAIECVHCLPEFWSNAERTACIPKQVEFLSFSDTMGITLMAISLIGSFCTCVVALIFSCHRITPIVRANNSELSFLLLFSLTLCFLCSLTFIGRPSEWSCMLRHTAFGITFVLCISCILGKTMVVLMAFKATLPGSNVMKWFGPAQQKAIITFCTLVQVIICTVWLVVAPPTPRQLMPRESVLVILLCDEGSAIAFALVLGYIGLLAGLCLLLAFLARKLPDNFNEARLITFSMLIFCAVWIAFVPAYISSPGKYSTVTEVFAILASSYGLLGCIFAPKCYIILLRPEKNTWKHIMSKAATDKF
ncbi:hypothetical protein PFLUV_G00023460 [Perca fluviatilis]|uniref:G-protein coupled receptors family 3 profile domain-containing protein n=1 Tax=Perca fluviatilis TaxID=8168 RepID=A0A6A5FQB9_PERFL|nr:hypothetical protein PFLUV_G00023460 [Perca fluviatilis]